MAAAATRRAGGLPVERLSAAESSLHDEGKPPMNMKRQFGAAVQKAAAPAGDAESGETEA